MREHAVLYAAAAIKFAGVTAMAFIAVGTLRIVARLLGPNGEGDIEEARLRQDARRAARKEARDA